MKRLREHIKRNSIIWIASLATALVFVLSAQLHVHVHDHQHDSHTGQHSHHSIVHKAHVGDELNIEHHDGSDISTVDIAPEGLSKYFASALLAAVFATLILFLFSPLKPLHLLRFNADVPLRHWCNGSPPPLRAPPR